MPKVPRYSNFKPASALTSQIKRRIRHRDTKAELLLRRELWRRGFRFRVNVKELPGKPDIVFSRARVIVFCDGDFWHGRDWNNRRKRLIAGINAPYWTAKIAANIKRGRQVSESLEMEGWVVLRFWESDIQRNTTSIAKQVAAVLRRK